MMKYMTAGAALLLTTTAATAGGIDRSSQFLGPLFEEGGETGSHVQLGFGRISPSAEASNLSVSDPLTSYNSISFAYKTDLTDDLSLAIIVEEPFGADIRYDLNSVFGGGGASVNSEQISAVLRYKIDPNWSVIGGIRALQVDGFIDTFTFDFAGNPGAATPISLQADSDIAISSVVGVAYERPEIALRVALSYNSGASVDFDGSETIFGDLARTVVAATGDTSFTVDFPESINLEFQTGVAEDTLVFGSIRHAFYDGFNLSTPSNPALLGLDTNFVNFTSDSTTYNVGVGRRFNDNWSGSVSYTYESQGTIPSTTALAPTTGVSGINLGVRYEQDAYSIAGGISYLVPGDQLVNSALGQASFDDNEAIAVGFRLGYNF